MQSSTLALLAAALPFALAERPKLTPEQIAHRAVSHAENVRVCKYSAWTWAAIIFVVLVHRWTRTLLSHIRQLANLNNGSASDGKQRYFSIPDEKWATVKRHVITAPLLRKRHNREFNLSDAANVGTLPSRLETFVLLGYFALNCALAVITIDWHNPKQWYDDGRNRMGVLATLNMIPLFVLAGRNNPFIWLLDISFDTYNLVHRWVGRIVVFEAVAHMAFWMAGEIATEGQAGWTSIGQAIVGSQFIMTGLIGAAAFAAILLQSPSIIRHAFYETFLHLHIALVITAVVGVWIHTKTMLWQSFLLAAIVCWMIERFFRMFSLIRRNTGKGLTKAEVEALPGDSVRVTLRISRPWHFQPGQHIYLYMPSVGLWTSHPFSLAWSAGETDYTSDKAGLPLTRQDMNSGNSKAATVSLIIRRRTGFTDRMFRKAEKSPANKFSTTAFIEGPYGHQSFASYGTVMLFAAGVGITHQVPHVRALVAGFANGTCATRKVILVWVIQSPEHLEWIRPWMTEILGMEKRRDVLKILLFVTRPRSTKEIHSPSASVQMYPGRPEIGALVEKEQQNQVGAMVVSCCGTGSLSDDIRKAVRERCQKTEIDFSEEAFSW